MELLTFKHRNVAGIYFIVASNGSTYVGQSYNLYMRMHQHLNKLKEKCHDNKHLQSIYKKYGKESLTFYVLKTLLPETRKRYTKKQIAKLLTPVEQTYFTIYEPDINKHPWAGSSLGCKMPEGFGEECSKRYKGRKPSPETIEKLKRAMKGHKQTPEHVAKRSAYFIKEYKLFHETLGWVEGKNINELARSIKCHGSNLRAVKDGKIYTSYGFYKSEEYYLDKNKWLEDHPVPKSNLPGVQWNRLANKWAGTFKKKGYKSKTFLRKTELEAYQAIQEHRKSLGLDYDTIVS